MKDIMASDNEKTKDDAVITDPVFPFMKNKRQQIIDYLREGKTYKQIQDEIRVSPCRISAIKRLLEKQDQIKNILETFEDDENSSNSSKIGSISSKNRVLDEEFCCSAGLNGSEIAIVVAFQREKLQLMKEQYLDDREFQEKFLQAKTLETKNKEKELKLREEELQFKKKEAERPLKELFYRLKQLSEVDAASNWGFSEVSDRLIELKKLEFDYKKQAYVDNFNFDVSPHAKMIEGVIKVFEQYKLETQANPKKSFGFEIKLALIVATAMFNQIDFQVG